MKVALKQQYLETATGGGSAYELTLTSCIETPGRDEHRWLSGLEQTPRFGDQTDRLGGMDGKKAILKFGYEDAGWPLEPAINAFALIAARHGSLGPRCSAVYTP